MLSSAVASGWDLPAARAAIGRWLGAYVVVVAILVFALWDMVVKPRDMRHGWRENGPFAFRLYRSRHADP